MIVIDVGCAQHGADESIEFLTEEYHPAVLYGFDPAAEESQAIVGGSTLVDVKPWVAWVWNGEIGFKLDGLRGQVDRRSRKHKCFDLAEFIMELDDRSGEVVVKIDAEGAEYTLLPHLHRTGADQRLSMLLVEWHCEVCGLGGNGRHRDGCEADRDWWFERREQLEQLMSCELGTWDR